MIDVKSAVRIAIQYLHEFDEFIPTRSIRLEETEYDDAGYWLITLSTLSTDDAPSNIGSLGILSQRRIYKQFKIDANSGDVKSMKVRTLQPAE